MFGNITPEKAIAITKICAVINSYWPLSAGASKLKLFVYNALRVLSVTCAVTVFVPLMYSTYVHFDEPALSSKAAIMGIACIETTANVINSCVYQDLQRRLIEEMITFCKNATEYERDILQQYVDKYTPFYAFTMIWNTVTAVLMIFGTLLTPQLFPLAAEYPFRVDYEPVYSIIYVEHLYLCVVSLSTLHSNMIVGLLVLFASAKFEILMADFRAAITVADLKNCMKQYYIVRKYAEDVVEGVQYIAINTIAVCICNVVLSGLNIIAKQPLAEKGPFIFGVGTGLMIVYMCALPCDTLMDLSENAIKTVYESIWYEQSGSVAKMVFHMMVPQSPIVISIPGVMAALSLNYYCSYVTNVFSLFSTLRVVMDRDEDDDNEMLPLIGSHNATCCD